MRLVLAALSRPISLLMLVLAAAPAAGLALQRMTVEVTGSPSLRRRAAPRPCPEAGQ